MIGDVCNNGKYCYSFKKSEPGEIAEAVRKALEKPLQTPEEHIKRFTPEKFTERLLSVVNEVLEGG